MRINVYEEKRDEEDEQGPRCKAKFPGCTIYAMFRIPCRREGMECYSCASCSAHWKAKCLSDSSLRNLCPRCAEHPATQTGNAAPATALPPPLQGAAAVAINEALRLEGITPDIRGRVLIRLKRDLAPWLENEPTAREPVR